MGETEVDEGRQVDSVRVYCVYVERVGFWFGTEADLNAVVLVYGVLFLDWKQENQPFQGVCGPVSC